MPPLCGALTHPASAWHPPPWLSRQQLPGGRLLLDSRCTAHANRMHGCTCNSHCHCLLYLSCNHRRPIATNMRRYAMAKWLARSASLCLASLLPPLFCTFPTCPVDFLWVPGSASPLLHLITRALMRTSPGTLKNPKLTPLEAAVHCSQPVSSGYLSLVASHSAVGMPRPVR